MSEHQSTQSSTQEQAPSSLLEKSLSRRNVVILGSVGLTSVGLESARRNWLTSPGENSEDIEVDTPIGRAEELRVLAETEGPDGIIKFFQITKEQAPTPSAFAEAFSERVRDWITAGCTPAEASEYTPDTLGDFQAEMNDKYSIPAILALGGNATIDESEGGEPTTAPLYQAVAGAHNRMLKHYLENMTKDEHPPHIEVEVIGYEMGTPDPYNNRFPLSVDVKYILQGEASGLLTISGSLNLLLHTAGDVYEVTLESDNPDALFEFGRG